MKAYERFVIWLEYFNSELKRRQGRRLPLNAAIRSPTLKELDEAVAEFREAMAKFLTTHKGNNGR